MMLLEIKAIYEAIDFSFFVIMVEILKILNHMYQINKNLYGNFETSLSLFIELNIICMFSPRQPTMNRRTFRCTSDDFNMVSW